MKSSVNVNVEQLAVRTNIFVSPPLQLHNRDRDSYTIEEYIRILIIVITIIIIIIIIIISIEDSI